MSEKKNSLEEKRILQKKLQWYTLEAEDGEFNATEVEAMLERLVSWNRCRKRRTEQIFRSPKEALKRFYQKYAGENVGKLSKKRGRDVGNPVSFVLTTYRRYVKLRK